MQLHVKHEVNDMLTLNCTEGDVCDSTQYVALIQKSSYFLLIWEINSAVSQDKHTHRDKVCIIKTSLGQLNLRLIHVKWQKFDYNFNN